VHRSPRCRGALAHLAANSQRAGCQGCSRPAAAPARLRGENFPRSQEDVIISADLSPIGSDLAGEDEPLLTARANAERLGGAVPVAPVTGAALRFLVTAIGARSVVEIGTGCGVSGIWLLRGMRPGSVLTSVDIEPEHHRMAREAFSSAGFASSRYRLITGRALEVLPRLADGAYDMVFCDADVREYAEYLAAALRLLSPGGIMAFDNALWAGRGAGAPHGELAAAAISEVTDRLRADDGLVPLLLPIGGGLLAAVKQTG
jgi:predicted O-methyltransferase YrrM